jgi:hypothetical protein
MTTYSTASDGSNTFHVVATRPNGGPPRVIGTYGTEAEARSIAESLNQRTSTEAAQRTSRGGPA